MSFQQEYNNGAYLKHCTLPSRLKDTLTFNQDILYFTLMCYHWGWLKKKKKHGYGISPAMMNRADDKKLRVFMALAWEGHRKDTHHVRSIVCGQVRYHLCCVGQGRVRNNSITLCTVTGNSTPICAQVCLKRMSRV